MHRRRPEEHGTWTAADFSLDLDQLFDVTQFIGKAAHGLTEGGASGGPADRRPAAIASGQARALDLGGSRLRAALVNRAGDDTRIVFGPLARDMPWQRGRALAPERFFGLQAQILEALEGDCDLPLGYCFSYPSKPTADGDARLVGWTKGVEVPGVVGRRVGRLLCDHLARRGRINCRRVRVINDTVALLWAGLTGPPADLYLGLVVGTGANLAAFWPDPGLAGGEVAVNLEAGRFYPPHLTVLDDRVDRESENPGAQRFEKAVSGLYLPRLLKAAYPKAPISDDSRTMIGLIEADPVDAALETDMARALLQRSARMVAALLAAVIGLRCGAGRIATVRVVAEGGLFWSRAEGSFDYRRILSEALAELLCRQGLASVRVVMDRVADATLVGSALAALQGG